jgi:hypothetical protein
MGCIMRKPIKSLRKKRRTWLKIPIVVLVTVILWSGAATSYNIVLFNTWYPGQPVRVAFIVCFFVANIVIQILSRLGILPLDRAYTRSACAIEKLIQFAALVAEYLNDDGKVHYIHSVKYTPIIANLFFAIVMLGLDRIFAYLLQVYRKKMRSRARPATKRTRPKTKRNTPVMRVRRRRPRRGK